MLLHVEVLKQGGAFESAALFFVFLFFRVFGSDQNFENRAILIGFNIVIKSGFMNENATKADGPSVGMAVLGFFIPIVGIIAWLILRARQPLQARSAIKGALAGFVLQFLIILALYSWGSSIKNSPEYKAMSAAATATAQAPQKR